MIRSPWSLQGIEMRGSDGRTESLFSYRWLSGPWPRNRTAGARQESLVCVKVPASCTIGQTFRDLLRPAYALYYTP